MRRNESKLNSEITQNLTEAKNNFKVLNGQFLLMFMLTRNYLCIGIKCNTPHLISVALSVHPERLHSVQITMNQNVSV